MTRINFEFKNKHEMDTADLSDAKIDSVALTLDNDILWVLKSKNPATWIAVDDSNMTISCENFEKLKTRFEVSIKYRFTEFVCLGRNPGLKDGYGQSEVEAFADYLIQNRWEPVQG